MIINILKYIVRLAIKGRPTPAQGQGNIYRYNLYWKGQMCVGKKMFPSEWSKAKVNQKIQEAYDNFKDMPPLNRRAFFEMTSMTNDGIIIKILLSHSGKIIVAFPDF